LKFGNKATLIALACVFLTSCFYEESSVRELTPLASSLMEKVQKSS
jgi:hypothetical protein